MVENICKKCLKPFMVHEHRKDAAKFCGYQCYWESMRGTVKQSTKVSSPCRFCGKDRLIKPSRLKTSHYCSRSCHAAHVRSVGDQRLGYKTTYAPKEPCKKRDLHRVIMEKHIGRRLEFNEIVHHKNGNTHDNRLENLEIMSRREHQQLHLKETFERRHK